MRQFPCLLGIAIFASGCALASPPATCPIPGELQHWQADYCMAKIGTDDIIAAGPCLERESQFRFRSACNGKLHYKQAMCELSVRAGSYSGSVDRCVKDPLYIGLTVRNDGA
jgi:hypothetical protein